MLRNMASCSIHSIQINNLKSDNFNNWLFRLRAVLEEKGVLYCIQSLTSETKDTKFIKDDATAKNIIISCLSGTHLGIIKECTTSKSMIEKLKNTFQRKSVVSKLYLRRQLLSLKCMENEKLEIYFQKFNSIIEDLENNNEKLLELDKICYLLIGLPQKYETVITAIETLNKDDLKFENVTARLLDEELKMTSKNNENNDENAFIVCFKCQNRGHKAINCKYYGQGRGQGWTCQGDP
ncbi:unnamed protein product, partial [Brenthis ino]